MSICLGRTALFTIAASGIAPLSYQWKKGDTAIPGATLQWFAIASVSSNDAGNYKVEVTNPYGTVTSSEATLTVNSHPQITAQPADITCCPGSSATFSVTASGTGLLSYQWKKNKNPVGKTSPALSINPVSSGDAGIYTVDVTNVCGTVTSRWANLTVNSTPEIICQPNDVTICEGECCNIQHKSFRYKTD